MVSFRTLGALDLVGPDGTRQESILRQPRLLAVLCFLVLSPGGVRRRSAVIAMFWPEADERRARHNLNQAIYALRRALGDVVFSNGPDEIGVNRTQIHCDAVQLEGTAGGHDPAAVVDVYRGDFAEGLSIAGSADFQYWLDAERTRLRILARHAALTAADAAQAQGRLDDAIAYVNAAQRWSPHDESIAARQIDLLEARNDRAGAVLAYREFAQRLHTEFDLEPSPDLQARVGSLIEGAAFEGAPYQDPVRALARAQDGWPRDVTAPTDSRWFRLRVALATVIITAPIVTMLWRFAGGALANTSWQPAPPQALAEFEVGMNGLLAQDFTAREHFQRAAQLDTTFAAAALEAAWTYCLSHLGPGCWQLPAARIDSLRDLAARHAARLTRAQRFHLEALNARLLNNPLEEYRGLREAAQLDPGRYSLEFADVASRLGRWDDALRAATRSPSPMLGASNYWFITSTSMHALGRHAEAIDSIAVWRTANPEWERQFLLFETAELGALGMTDILFERVNRRRGMPNGGIGAFNLLMGAGREMLVHARPDARLILDSAIVILERVSPDLFNGRALDAYYLAGRYDKVLLVLDSLRARGKVPGRTIS
jgi:DNA-binding SARP family transcriptional activator